jgi:hypothetical protein
MEARVTTGQRRWAVGGGLTPAESPAPSGDRALVRHDSRLNARIELRTSTSRSTSATAGRLPSAVASAEE